MSREKSTHPNCAVLALLFAVLFPVLAADRGRVRDFGVHTGILRPGPLNAITDVAGVRVGHCTLIQGDSVRTGVTAVLPHGENLFQKKLPAAVFVANGFGKLAGSTQVQELGEIETPVVLTNTLSVGTGMNALIRHTLEQTGNEEVGSVNAVVGETNDGWLNDIRGGHVREEHVIEAIRNASAGPVAEGCVGAGTGTVCLGFKGGIGTASRKLPEDLGGWTVGVLVQTNFGGILSINGAPVGRELGRHYLSEWDDGSCMIVLATDAPVLHRNLERLAARAVLGIARCGGFCSNGSGDYVIAFSVHPGCRLPHQGEEMLTVTELRNDRMTPLFLAAVEATEEAILNSLFQATGMTGRSGHQVQALPIEESLVLLKKHGALFWKGIGTERNR